MGLGQTLGKIMSLVTKTLAYVEAEIIFATLCRYLSYSSHR